MDPSWLRTIVSFVSSCLFLFWCLREPAGGEYEAESWRWSRAAARAIASALLLASGSFLPFLLRWRSSKPSASQLADDAVSLVWLLIFTFLMGSVVYLLLLLRAPRSNDFSNQSIEAMKLEHQSCLTLFQSGATCIVVVFLGAMLSPALGAASLTGTGVVARLGWVFYCFAGGIIWFLMPCLAKAKFLRSELQQSRKQFDADCQVDVCRSPRPILWAPAHVRVVFYRPSRRRVALVIKPS
jgi:hypothetical protein